jgi:hypothetical protein
MNKKAIVFTGQIRNEKGFVEFLDMLNSQSRESRPLLYFSTWKGELDKYKLAAKKLKELDANIFEQEQPNLRLTGHTLHQIVALDAVLGSIEPDTYVFKSRPDMCSDDHTNLYRIFMTSNPEPVVNMFLQNIAPKYKFKVSGYNLAHPFYINDMTYCGISNDLKMLVRLPFVMMTRFNPMSAEQMIWGGAPIESIRIFDNYFRVNAGLLNDKDSSLSNAKMLKEFTGYHFALGAYYLLLSSWFSTFNRTQVSPNTTFDFSLDDMLWSDIRAPFFHHNPIYFSNWVNSTTVIERILQANFCHTEFGDSIMNTIGILKDVNQPQEYLSKEIEWSAHQYSEKLERLHISGNHLHWKQEDRVWINSKPPRWNLMDHDGSLIEKLESEINYLRRANDSLRDRLLTKD